MSNHKLVVGNWKLHPATLSEARRIIKQTRDIAAELKHTSVVICPPFPYISAAISKRGKDSLSVGSQSVSMHESGSHTGEVSAAMIADLGAKYSIIGHSEERARGDSDKIISQKLLQALLAGLKPILCVGESLRDEGGAYLEILKDQIRNGFADIPKKYARDIILAYEPVWKIGQAEAMSPADINESSIFVKKVFSDVFGPESAVRTPVLYGGSVNPNNAAEIISVGKVEGLLVGRESVNIVGFRELLRAVDAVK